MISATEIKSRIHALRRWMRQEGLSAFVVPDTDPHASEYTPTHWHARQWISGFDGSSGTVVITDTAAALWTDSRYYLAAETGLTDTTIALMRASDAETPSVGEWLATNLSPGQRVGLDPALVTADFYNALCTPLLAQNIHIYFSGDPFSILWIDRPSLPTNPVVVQPLQWAGVTPSEKLSQLRQTLKEAGTVGLLITALDEIAWLLNLRGADVACNPVFVAYLLVMSDSATLFVQVEKLTHKARTQLTEAGVQVLPYEELLPYITQYVHDINMWVSPQTNMMAFTQLSKTNNVHIAASPVALMKAVKNDAEIVGMRQAMLRDGVALVHFLSDFVQRVKDGHETELTAAQRLASLRAQQDLYQGVSFETIAGYGPHGAIVHYEATSESALSLQPKGLILIDSGAQYLDGTTDITRTIALGPLTEEERHIYTLVLKGHIALSRGRFPHGTTGTQLDLAARYDMWQEGYNYGHGTGHGVGAYLNVHEGPHQIRMNHVPTPLQVGMTVTDEPGLYLNERFGVRIENVLLISSFRKTEFGNFLQFEPLTLCPIDTTPIERSMLNETEVAWLNAYHAHVREMLLPLIDNVGVRNYLIHATQPLT